jgi:hypothetical protein
MKAKCPSCGSIIADVELQGPTVGNRFSGPLMTGYTATRSRENDLSPR